MLLEAAFIEEQFRWKLGLPILIALAREPVAQDQLSMAEKSLSRNFRKSPRMDSWLRGRAALKQLLRRLGKSTDTGAIRFPHPALTLSHSSRFAIAAGVRASTSGLGIDVEHLRPARSGTERFFLNQKEQAWIHAMHPSNRPLELLRLWTVKEALFKANLRNRDSLVGHYSVDNPVALAGWGSWREEADAPYRYATVPLRDGFVTLAVGLRRKEASSVSKQNADSRGSDGSARSRSSA